MNGNVMKTQFVAAGTLQVRVDVPDLHPGVYKVIWTNGSKSAFATIVVLPR